MGGAGRRPEKREKEEILAHDGRNTKSRDGNCRLDSGTQGDANQIARDSPEKRNAMEVFRASRDVTGGEEEADDAGAVKLGDSNGWRHVEEDVEAEPTSKGLGSRSFDEKHLQQGWRRTRRRRPGQRRTVGSPAMAARAREKGDRGTCETHGWPGFYSLGCRVGARTPRTARRRSLGGAWAVEAERR